MLIYIVEDDVNIQEIESFALKNSGYEIKSFSCARDFYEGLAEKLPDLVLLDIMLPDEDGLEILKKLIKNVQIKGFRKGQAPESMAKNYVDPNKLINEAINIALPSMYDEAIKEFKLVPFAQPDVEVTDLTDEALKVKFTITVYPEVKLGQYKDIHLERIN